MRVVGTFDEVRALRKGRVGLVATMGYFHEGHLSLMDAARADCATVIVSLFVNSLQFGPGEDFATYPRDVDRDTGLAADRGVDVLFIPDPQYMYPEPPVTRVTVSELTGRLEGASRPGHFAGVATVVAKLLFGIGPDAAYFGRKDAQQLAVVTRMTADLSVPVEIVGCPIVREPDGLALSSRNVRLSAEERGRAGALSHALFVAAEAAESGLRDGAALEERARGELSAARIDAEYVEMVDAATFRRLPTLDRQSYLALAARVSDVRLIDNIRFDVDGPRVAADRGQLLEAPSLLGGV